MGNRIKALRKKSGFTQVQIGKYLEVDQSMVAKLEKGERALTTVQLSRLADLFACSEDYVLGYDSSEEPRSIAFRIENPSVETMRVVSAVNKIAANMNLLNRILEADNAE